MATELPARERLLMDSGWRFSLGHASDPAKDFGYGAGAPFAKAGGFGGAAGPGFNDSGWRKVDLPHDWVVEQDIDPNGDGNMNSHGYRKVGGNYPDCSIGWYRRSFEIPESDEGRRISLEFDGVFRDCVVWLNGHYLTRNLSGYMGFRADVTDYLNYGGRNVLVVRADASQMEGWFYEGAGIYRHVWLTKTSPVHIAPHGIFVSSTVGRGSAKVQVQTTVTNETSQVAKVVVQTEIMGPDGKAVATLKGKAQTVQPGASTTVSSAATVANPNLWSIEEPNLYKAATKVAMDGQSVDSVETTFGIRTFRFDKDKGFFLNGKPVKIKGVCCHQDHAGVGSALPDRVNVYRIERLKEMGCNAYRSSHNPPTPELLDACDRLGMIVMDENRMIGANEETLGQMRDLVLRDRNHPSIVLWSIGNEEPIQGSPTGKRFAVAMMRAIAQLDTTRPVTCAGNNGSQWEGINSVVDVRGWNYYVVGNPDEYHAAHPGQAIVGSEEASTLSTRGEYANDPVKGYVSAYDVNKPGWGSLAESWWKFAMARPWFAGAFVWTGFDYRGEPTPYAWPCINSHFGIMDMCGFPKDNFYYYQAWWTDKPMVHLFPHWNWTGKEGQEIEVWVHSNCESVELFLNGQSLGAKKVEPYTHLSWKVPYAPGVLEARGSKGGQALVTDRVETTGAPASVALSADRATLNADGEDVAMVTVSVRDAQGRIVPFAGNEIAFEIEGGARIIGVGNGDPSSHEADQYPPLIRRVALEGWKMALVPDDKGKPEAAALFEYASWNPVRVDREDGAIQQPNSTAVFRTEFDLTPAEAAARQTLEFGMVDDHGWIFLNGRKVGEAHEWAVGHAFDVSGLLRAGSNELKVVVRNDEGRGGLAKGVALVSQSTQGWKRRVFHGLCQVIVQTSTKSGVATLKATASGLMPASLDLALQKATVRPFVK